MEKTSGYTISETGNALTWPYRLLAWCLRTIYFGYIRIVGARNTSSPHRGGRLVISSHRNGAIDGYMVLRAFPDVQFLVSVQLLRSWLLRRMFDGIPVVRDKDRQRYGIRRAAFADPIAAACAHLRAGGDLAIFPEGSSEWGYKPLPYQRGAARIIRTLLAEGVSLEVVPVGLHYCAPDRFRSSAEVFVGATITLPSQTYDESVRDWENRIHVTIGQALDAVSVNCGNEEEFNLVQGYANSMQPQGYSYAQALLDAQQRLQQSRPLPITAPIPASRRWPWDWLLAACFAVVTGPVLFASWVAGRYADGRNTVTFFRMAATTVTIIPWIVLLVLVLLHWPLPSMISMALAILGWHRWPNILTRVAI